MMRKVLKRVGIVLTLIVVLAVLMTSVAMAKNLEPGNTECPGVCNQTQTKECLQDGNCECLGDQTQTQTKDCLQVKDCECLGDQIQTQDGKLNRNMSRTGKVS